MPVENSSLLAKINVVFEVGYYPKTLNRGYRVPEVGGSSIDSGSNGNWVNFSMAEFQENSF